LIDIFLDIAEILLTLALNTNQSISQFIVIIGHKKSTTIQKSA